MSTHSATRRRVLVVTTWYPSPAVPVAGVFVRKDAQALAQDHDVMLVHLATPVAYASAPSREDDGGVAIRRLLLDPRDPRTVVRAVAEIRRLMRGADVLHTMAFSSILPLLGLPVRTPWVHTEHWSGLSAPYSLSTPLRRVMPTLRHAIAAPDVVVPVCDFLARPIREVRRGPVEIIPCIVDQPATLVPRRGGQVRGDQVRLVAVGGLLPGKDPLTAIETLAELRRRGHDAHLTWVGGGPLRGDVLARATTLGVADHLTLTGSLPPAEVGRRLDDADLFLLPTRFDNFCVSGAEALAHGRPVVIGANGGQAEYVTPQVGALVREQSPAAYADAVEDVLTRLADTSAEQIAADVRARFTTDAVRADYNRLYEELIGAATRPPSTGRMAGSIDVVIPTHTAERPVERAIASVLDDAPADTRVVLVCHGVAPDRVLHRVPQRYHASIDVVVHDDGIPSPAGPFNAGLAAATADFVSPMSSDDYARRGALRGWASVAARTGADCVIARVESDRGRLQRNPPTRLGLRTTGLDAARDRLFYRSVPQGLVRRSLVGPQAIQYTEGLVTGEDIAMTAQLWTSATRVAFALHEPAYVLADDADDRVSLAPRPAADDLRPLRLLVTQEWANVLPRATRLALAVKLLRIHIFGAVTNRMDAGLEKDDVEALRTVTLDLLAYAPDLRHVLSLAETRLVDAIVTGAQATTIIMAARRRNRHGRPETVLTADPAALLHRQGPLRLMLASTLMGSAPRHPDRVHGRRRA